MDLNEIRVGNYLHQKHLKKIDMVLGVKNGYLLTTCIIASNNWVGISLYEPIPLNDEVLLKCGFKYSEPVPNVRGILVNDIFEIGLDGEDFRLNQLSLRINKALIVKVKYLHQLQNICFSITRKELIWEE